MSEETKEQTEEVEVAETETAELNFETLVSEEVVPLYYNKSLIQPPFKLYRINSSGGRIYFRFQDEDKQTNPILYMGTGSITGEIATPRELKKYIGNKGWEYTQKEMQQWSLYGSLSDTLIATFIQYGKFDGGLQSLPERLRAYFNEQAFWVDDYDLAIMQKFIQKDMIGFERFIYDRKAEFFMVEYPVVSEIDETATPIDFGCFFDTDKKVDGVKKDGTPKKTKDTVVERVCGLFNYKSGRIYNSYGIQCMAERHMFNESYPEFTELPIQSFNLTIRDFKKMNWGGRPTSDYNKPYQIKNWTLEASEDDFRNYLDIAKRKMEKKINRTITVIEGDMNLGDEPSKFVVTKTIKDLINSGDWKRFAKSNQELPELLKNNV